VIGTLILNIENAPGFWRNFARFKPAVVDMRGLRCAEPIP
jgi:hypothetical protein